MFREFFCARPKTAATAWTGLAVVVAYALFVAHVKANLNDFYARFYDLLQEAGGVALETGSGSGSGDADGSGELSVMAQYRQRVYDELWTFALIIAPLVSASPICKWIRSAWAFSWRTSLMKAYLVAWDTKQEPIEGASQRLHEDSQRFSDGLEGCLVTVLDAIFTLIVFSPILVKLSGEIAPPSDFGALSGAWLWVVAFASSLVGLTGAAFFGQKLVELEVANQRVEALLRKDLVLLETTPAMIVGTEPSHHPGSPSAGQRQHVFLPQTYFRETLQSLWKNYFLLFKHFGMLNFWLSLFDQIMVIFPYLIAAPLIFADDPAKRITLGTLIKMSNSFEKIFSSLSVIAENWGAINEFRSTYRRLREFEGKLYAKPERTMAGCLLPAASASVQLSECRRSSRRTAPGAPTEPPYPIVNGFSMDAEGPPPPPPPPATEPPPPPEPSTPSSDPDPSAAAAESVASMVVRALNGGGSGTTTRQGMPIEMHISHPPDFEDMRV
tara:strand:- start:418 stop:1911 length:1494 start_codon:yes stop_codon:yes gene_type:complete